MSCCEGSGLADYAAVPCPNPTCPARLSRLLWEAREPVDMLLNITEEVTGEIDQGLVRTRDEIDSYRTERGWNPHGFGGEVS